MRRNPAWGAQAVSVAPQKGAKSMVMFVFALMMGLCFWAGAMWASLPIIR